jgi:hypothetical protein
MGFRFRRSIRIIPGIRLNFSKGGVSTSVGGRGATINFGKRGTKTTVGLPGTGLSYSTQLPASGHDHAEPMGGTGIARPKSGGGVGLLVALLVILGIAGFMSFKGQSPAPATDATEAAVASLYVTARSLNCRAEPAMGAAPIASLAKGQMLKVAQVERVSGWVKLDLGNAQCWAREDHLSTTPGP